MLEPQEIRDRYGPLIWSTAYRILRDYSEALDCCQDVLCEVLQQAGRDETQDAYLRWLATRRAIDRLRNRTRNRERFPSTTDICEVQAAGPGPVEQAEFNELVDRVRHELTKLPERQAEAFWMRCVEEMSYAEIGRQLEIDTSAVGVLIHRAKLRLRQMLTDVTATYLQD